MGLEWPWVLPVGEVGPLIGAIQPPGLRFCPGSCRDLADSWGPGRLAALAGFSYRWHEGPVWLVFTPSVGVPPRGPFPLFDVGYRFTRSLGGSVRTSAHPIMVS